MDLPPHRIARFGAERLQHLLAQIIDLAISDDEFGTWLDQRDVGNGNEPRLWYDPHVDLWHVELLTYYDVDPGAIHGLLMDPRTGEIVQRVDYVWDGKFDHHGW